jgi:MFS family permease
VARRAGPSIWLLLVFDGAAIGAIFPFLTVMLQSRGFDPFQIGLITALTSAAFTIALPWWGHIADAVLGRVRTLQVASLGAGLTLLVFLGPLPPIGLAACIVAFTIIEAPIAALADALVVNAVSDPVRSYPRLRVLFSGAMAASALALGLIIDRTGYVAVPIFYAAAVAAIAVTAAFVPDVSRVHLATLEGRGEGRHGRRSPSPAPSLVLLGVASRSSA